MWHTDVPVRLLATQTKCWLCTALLALALIWLLEGNPGSVRAQTGSMTLTVQCRTVGGEPVPGVVVTVFDVASDVTLLRGTTDGNGTARFPQMSPGEVRVQLAGSLRSGISLRHT